MSASGSFQRAVEGTTCPRPIEVFWENTSAPMKSRVFDARLVALLREDDGGVPR
jgi:hypothetical protein